MSTSTPSPCRSPEGAVGVAKSRSTRWRAGVLIGVHLLFALHLVHLSSEGSTVSPVEPSEAMEFSKHSVINAGFVFFAVTILTTLVFGRFFCGWGCHLVALQDLARGLLMRIGIRPKPLRSRLLAIVPMIAFVYMFLWPVAYRLWVGDSFDSTHNAFFTSDFWKTFPGLVVALLTLFVCGFAIVYFLGAKGFCTYACPYGAIFGAVDHLAPGRIRVTDACEGCGHCTATCTSNVLVHQEVREHGMVVDAGCMKCMDCVSVCPKDALYFGFGRPGVAKRRRTPHRKRRPAFSWGEEAVLGVSFVAAFLAFRGLYSAIPFLLSLGIAGIAAYGTLCGWRLLRRAEVRMQNLALKREKLTPAGRTFALGFLLFASLWAHSGWIRFHDWRAGTEMKELTSARERFFRGDQSPLEGAEAKHLAALERHNDVGLNHGLVSTSDAAYRAAWARMLGGDREGYSDWMARAVELESRRSMHAEEYAGFLAAHGEYERAESTFRRALELASDPVPVALELAQFLAQARQDLDGALRVVEEVLDEHPHNAALHQLLGTLAAARGDTAAAIASMERAVEIAPGHFEYRNRLAMALMTTGETERGLAVLREGIALRPEGIEERTAYGLAAQAAGNLTDAEDSFREAIELDPEGAGRAMAGLAGLLQQTGREGEAEDWIERARRAALAPPPAPEPDH